VSAALVGYYASMKTGWLTPMACAVLIFAAVACKPRVRPALDATTAPPGQGWNCYKHDSAGTVALGICYRDAAECTAKGAEDGGSVCKPQSEAFCVDLRPGGHPHDTRCVATTADCQELMRNFEGLGPSQCASVP
jgi:hypothetical protein